MNTEIAKLEREAKILAIVAKTAFFFLCGYALAQLIF